MAERWKGPHAPEPAARAEAAEAGTTADLAGSSLPPPEPARVPALRLPAETPAAGAPAAETPAATPPESAQGPPTRLPTDPYATRPSAQAAWPPAIPGYALLG